MRHQTQFEAHSKESGRVGGETTGAHMNYKNHLIFLSASLHPPSGELMPAAGLLL